MDTGRFAKTGPTRRTHSGYETDRGRTGRRRHGRDTVAAEWRDNTDINTDVRTENLMQTGQVSYGKENTQELK